MTDAGLLLAFAGVTAALAALVAVHPSVTQARLGKVLAFVALFMLPALSVWAGFSIQMERAQTTEFCLSCHVMSDYGRSLYVDDPSYVPAAHFQNNRVPRDRACYTCHTDYTMFGGVRSKLRGVRHLYVQYLGDGARARPDPALRAVQQPRMPALPRRRAEVRGACRRTSRRPSCSPT